MSDELARQVLDRAREEASRLHHEYIGTEHILLGLLREEDGMAVTVLQNLNVHLDDIRRRIEDVVKTGSAPQTSDLPYTTRAQKVLELARAEARDLSHSDIGPEHLLLGLLREARGIAGQVLAHAGVNLHVARAETLRVLATGASQGGVADPTDPAQRVLQPRGWPRPSGYSDGVSVAGRLVVLAGQIGWNPTTGKFESDELTAQVRRALENIVTLLAAAGAEPRHLVRLTWFVTDRDAYMGARPEIGAAYRDVIGAHYPPMSLVFVSALVEARAKVEIEATAVVPE